MEIQTGSHIKAASFVQSIVRAVKTAHSLPESRPDRRRLRTLLHRGQEGSALVEIALVMPMILGLLTAIFTFAIGFNNQLTLTSAVGSGAQYLQLIRTTTTDPCKDTLTAIENAAQTLTPTSIKLTFNFNGTTVPSNSCPTYQVYLAQGQPVTVSATYPCVLMIYGTKFTNTCQLSAKVTEYEY
jgi:Flp pilus assembly protein TadG